MKKGEEKEDVVLTEEEKQNLLKLKDILVLGINEVTKALEKGLLQLLLVGDHDQDHVWWWEDLVKHGYVLASDFMGKGRFSRDKVEPVY